MAYSIVAILVSASLSLVILYQIQESTKNEIRHSLFEKAKAEQIKTTRTIAGKIASDLDSRMSRLGQLAASEKLQDGLFTESATATLLDEKFSELQSLYFVDSAFIIDNNNILVVASGNSNFTRLIGLDFSQRDYIMELAQSRAPVFSNWYLGADGNSKVTVVYPIINRDTGKMVGAVGASVIAKPFFSTYGNIYDFNSSQYINVLDRKAVFAASPNPSVVGLSFYDEKVQDEFVKRNAVLNKFYAEVLSGKASSAVFDVGFGERLATGQPIVVNGKPVYFLAVGIPQI
ncbi:MAG: cache domain-containing protein [Nitrososphaera sp.]